MIQAPASPRAAMIGQMCCKDSVNGVCGCPDPRQHLVTSCCSVPSPNENLPLWESNRTLLMQASCRQLLSSIFWSTFRTRVFSVPWNVNSRDPALIASITPKVSRSTAEAVLWKHINPRLGQPPYFLLGPFPFLTFHRSSQASLKQRPSLSSYDCHLNMSGWLGLLSFFGGRPITAADAGLSRSSLGSFQPEKALEGRGKSIDWPAPTCWAKDPIPGVSPCWVLVTSNRVQNGWQLVGCRQMVQLSQLRLILFIEPGGFIKKFTHSDPDGFHPRSAKTSPVFPLPRCPLGDTMSPPKAVSRGEPIKHPWPPPPHCLDTAVDPRSAASAADWGMPNELGGEARGRSALPAPYLRLSKSVTCTSNVLLSKERGLVCLEAVGVWVIYSLSFSLEKQLLIELEGSIRQRDITSTILPATGTATCQEGFSCSLCLWCAIIFYEKKGKMASLGCLSYFQKINAITSLRWHAVEMAVCSQGAIRGPALWEGVWAKVEPIPDEGSSSSFGSFCPSGLPRSHLEVPVIDRGTHWAVRTRRGWWRVLISSDGSQTQAPQMPYATGQPSPLWPEHLLLKTRGALSAKRAWQQLPSRSCRPHAAVPGVGAFDHRAAVHAAPSLAGCSQGFASTQATTPATEFVLLYWTSHFPVPSAATWRTEASSPAFQVTPQLLNHHSPSKGA